MKKIRLLFSAGMMLIFAAICAVSTAFFMPKPNQAPLVQAVAASTISDSYQNVTWTFNADTGALSITGTGAMPDIEDFELPTAWRQYKAQVRTLHIADTITSIGINAFENFTNLCEVTIGSGVTKIGTSAFRYCSALKELCLPANVQEISNFAFQSSAVQHLTLSNGLLTIGKKAFADCTALQAVHIPDTVTQMGVNCFADCTAIGTVTIGNGLTEIPASAFENCTSLQTLDLGDGAQTVGEGAFKNCPSLTSLRIGNRVQTILKNAFYGCEKLAELYLSDSVKTIAEYAFYGCKYLHTLWIGASLTTIENNVFVFPMPNDRFDVVYVHAPAVAKNLSDKTVFGRLAQHVLTFAFADGLEINDFIKEEFAQKEDIQYKGTVYQIYTKLGHLQHDWQPYEIPSSSCLQAGFQGERCADCYLIKGEETFAHDYAYQPTDTQTHLKICTICNEQQSNQHTWDDGTQTLAPTHTSTGSEKYVCQQCGFSDIRTIEKLPEHTFSEWQTTTPATCTAQGVSTRSCPCGERETQTIDATGHYYQSTDTPPTCTSGGYITHVCVWCNHTYQDHCYQPTGHSYTDQNDLTCNVCGASRPPLPDAPDTPDEPDNPDTPDEPDVPDNPDTPDEPDDTPDTPDNLEEPTDTTAPNTDANPPNSTIDASIYEKAIKNSAKIGAITATVTTAALCLGWYALSSAVRKIKKNRQDEWADEESKQ